MTPGTRGPTIKLSKQGPLADSNNEENAGGASRSAATKGKGKAWDRPRVDEAQDDIIETVSICAMSVDADTYVCMRPSCLLSIANSCILYTGDIDIFSSFNRKVCRCQVARHFCMSEILQPTTGGVSSLVTQWPHRSSPPLPCSRHQPLVALSHITYSLLIVLCPQWSRR